MRRPRQPPPVSAVDLSSALRGLEASVAVTLPTLRLQAARLALARATLRKIPPEGLLLGTVNVLGTADTILGALEDWVRARIRARVENPDLEPMRRAVRKQVRRRRDGKA